MAKREWSNKYGRFRQKLLTYARGRVLEVGVGTGTNLQYYDNHVTEFVGVDWSEQMILKAFGKLSDFKDEIAEA